MLAKVQKSLRSVKCCAKSWPVSEDSRGEALSESQSRSCEASDACCAFEAQHAPWLTAGMSSSQRLDAVYDMKQLNQKAAPARRPLTREAIKTGPSVIQVWKGPLADGPMRVRVYFERKRVHFILGGFQCQI